MTKVIAAPALLLALLILAVPFLVRAESGSEESLSSTVLSCLKSAVATRESTLKTGWMAFGDDVEDAYTARGIALDAAYTAGQTRKEVKEDVKAAWKTFKSEVKGARSEWKDTRKDAWKAYKAAAKSCKAPSDVTESNEGGEA